MNVPLRCLVLPHEDGDGPLNMARDELLLELVSAEAGIAALRTYGWSVPTLSLGYFQSFRDATADPRWASRPLVRRPTGGGAIWHDQELTYALAVPRCHPLYRRNTELYQVVHATIQELLAAAGMSAARRGGASASQADAPRPLLCFADRDAEDLVIGPHKVVGSAQRRRAGAILQHGSVLLRTSEATPELPGAIDLTPFARLDPAWIGELRRRLPASLGFTTETTDWTPTQRLRAEELAESTYRHRDWLQRR
ncbi:MAG: lipoate--protein ligase [Isosphaeraceae bacterium]